MRPAHQVFNGKNFTMAISSKRSRRNSSQSYESLEPREMLAPVINVYGDATAGYRVSIYGDGNPNTGYVTFTNIAETRIRFEIDSVQRTFNVDEVKSAIFYGSDGNDTIENQTSFGVRMFGHDGDDVLIGGTGEDAIYGNDGNDQLIGGAGKDIIVGGLGADTIQGNGGDDQIYTNDYGLISNDADTVSGGQGLDRIDEAFDSLENDVLVYGAGLLIIQGDANDNYSKVSELANNSIRVDLDSETYYFQPGVVKEILFKGLAGDDTFVNLTSIRSTAEGFAGTDRLFGGSGADMLFGGTGNDVLHGKEGPDVLGEYQYSVVVAQGILYRQIFTTEGSGALDSGNDYMSGGAGNDFFRAGVGNDTLIAGTGSDYMWADDGDDYLVTQGVNDNARGADGNDSYTMRGGSVYDVIGSIVIRGSGQDEKVVYGGSGADIHLGGGDNEISATFLETFGTHRIQTGAGDDLIDIRIPRTQTSKYTILSGAGDDDVVLTARGQVTSRINLGLGNDTVVIRLHAAVVFAGGGDDELTGSQFDDRLYGQDGNDTIHGLEGEDYLAGGDGNDTIYGGDGDDYLGGQVGDDILYGEAGLDILFGGPGNDQEYQ